MLGLVSWSLGTCPHTCIEWKPFAQIQREKKIFYISMRYKETYILYSLLVSYVILPHGQLKDLVGNRSRKKNRYKTSLNKSL